MKTIKFLVLTFISLFAVVYIVYLTIIYFNQQNMVFRASGLPKNHIFNFYSDFDEVLMPTTDNKNLHGLLFKIPNPKGLIFYLHGNKGNVDMWGNSAIIYNTMGYDIFYLDYRGFGKSEGAIIDEKQVHEDVATAYKQVTKDYKKKNTIIIGYSIGTGLATYLATNQEHKKLVLQAPFYNFTEFTGPLAPGFPDFMKKFQFQNNLHLQKITTPIYIFHGTNDKLIPIENSVRLQKLQPNSAILYCLEGQNHVGINQNEVFIEKMKEILK